MALPPAETDPTFVREVDENLRRDQAQEFLRKNGPWIVGGLLLLLAAWVVWQLLWPWLQRTLADPTLGALSLVG